MFRKISLILFSVLWISANSEAAKVAPTCDVGTYLFKLLSEPLPEYSSWSKTAKSILTDLDFKTGVKQPRKLFGIENISVAQKNKETILILRDLDSYQVGLDKFSSDFEKIYERTPSRDETIEFFETRYSLYQSGMKNLIQQVKKTTHSDSRIWESAINEQMKTMASIFESAKKEMNPVVFRNKLNAYNRDMIGILTELRASVSLKGVKKISQLLSESAPVMEKLDSKLKELETKLMSDRDYLQKMQDRFPKMMNASTPEAMKNYTPAMRVAEIKKWIKAKEIDLVRESNGKTAWVEVKRNANQFSTSNFASAGTAKKSYLYQIKETKEIVEFLGLQNEIELEFLASAGFDESLTKELAEIGIKVLSP